MRGPRRSVTEGVRARRRAAGLPGRSVDIRRGSLSAVPAPAQTSSDAPDPTSPPDPIALAAFVARRGGRVLAYLDAVTTRERALTAAGEAFAAFRMARAADPDAEAAATALLRATRRAATIHAENPFRPEGRERSARRTSACDAMPRLLMAWTESRLPDDAVERLVHHLQECPDCRALRDGFDRAELGYRAGEAVTLDGVEVGLITTAMARASTPVPGPSATVPTPSRARARRTAIPAAPSAGTSATDDGPRASRAAAVGRRTAIPAPPPTAAPREDAPTPAAAGDTTTADVPAPRARPTDAGRLPADAPTTAPPARDAASSDATRPRRTPGRRDAPDDPLGPEALGYAVPRSGLPRPERRPAVPRARRRRRRRPPSAAVAAAQGTPVVGAGVDEERPSPCGDEPVRATDRRPRTGATTGVAAPEAAPSSDRAVPAAATTAPERDPDPTVRDADRARDTPGTQGSGGGAGREVAPATVVDHGLQRAGRRVLATPIVRQLGVPAVLLLAVLIAALIAAGVFAGQSEDTVPPVSRPTLPAVPSDPSAIPPLP